MDYQRCSILTSYNFEQLIIPNWLHDIWGIQTSNWSTNEWWTWLPCCLGNKPRFGNIYMTRFVLGVDPETFKCKCRLPKSGFAVWNTSFRDLQARCWFNSKKLHGTLFDAVCTDVVGTGWARPLGIVGSDVSQVSLIWRALARSQSPFICTALVFFVPGWRGYSSLSSLTLVFSIPRFITYLGLKHLPERIH